MKALKKGYEMLKTKEMKVAVVDFKMHINTDYDTTKTKKQMKTAFSRMMIGRKRRMLEVDNDDNTFTWYISCWNDIQVNQVPAVIATINGIAKKALNNKLAQRQAKRKGFDKDEIGRAKEMVEDGEDIVLREILPKSEWLVRKAQLTGNVVEGDVIDEPSDKEIFKGASALEIAKYKKEEEEGNV